MDHAVIIEFSKLANEHVAYLSKIVAAITAAEVFMIAHILKSTRLPFSQSPVSWALVGSAAANVVSLACGYFSNAGTLLALQNYAEGQNWTPSGAAELMNLVQIISLAIALFIFLVAFYFYSQILAASLISASSGRSKGGDQHE